jgi:formate/nitrite transporter FocA (FNT family)
MTTHRSAAATTTTTMNGQFAVTSFLARPAVAAGISFAVATAFAIAVPSASSPGVPAAVSRCTFSLSLSVVTSANSPPDVAAR